VAGAGGCGRLGWLAGWRRPTRVQGGAIWGGSVGAVTNSAMAARGRTRQRAAAELTGRAERDDRITAAAARVVAALEAIRANAERRALTVAAAQRAIADAERAERDANRAAADQLLAGVLALRAEGLTVAAIADRVVVPVPRVRQLIKQANTPAGAGAGALVVGGGVG
jgi:hypothetical protein